MENETNAGNLSNEQPFEAELVPADLPISPKEPVEWQHESPNTQDATNTLLSIWSAVLLIGTIAVVALYLYFFGHHLYSGDTPDHWNWLGGLVGVVAMVIRFFVILIVFIPYTIMSVMGISMSVRVIAKSRDLLKWFNCFLVVGHAIMLIPAVYIAFVARH